MDDGDGDGVLALWWDDPLLIDAGPGFPLCVFSGRCSGWPGTAFPFSALFGNGLVWAR